MCIICNCPGYESDADRFLVAFEAAQQHMKKAAEAMLQVSKIAAPADRARYDAIHKAMVRQCREWNRLEQKREHAP